MWVVVCMAMLAACGRFGFDGQHAVDSRNDGVAAGDARADVPGDVPADMLQAACPYELCDGFETGSFDSVWIATSGASVDTTVAHLGTHSAHFQSLARAIGQTGYYQIGQTTTLALGDPTFYVRAWVQFGALPTGTNAMELITAEQAGAQGEDALFVHATHMDVYEQWTDMGQPTTTAPPVGTWMCVLWTVTRDTGTSGSITLAGDIGPITQSGVPTDGTPLITRMGFGIGFAGTNVNVAQPAMDVWLDDIIIANTPLTCSQ